MDHRGDCNESPSGPLAVTFASHTNLTGSAEDGCYLCLLCKPGGKTQYDTKFESQQSAILTTSCLYNYVGIIHRGTIKIPTHYF